MAKKIIDLPNNWAPRDYQLPLWSYLENGGKRAVCAWHRRAGKDEVFLHWGAVCANTQSPGNYWHMLPEAAQAKKAIWEAVNPHTGRRRIDEAFPIELRENTRENDMFIRFKNGSTWQVVGSDNFMSLIGSPPKGVSFSEYKLADPNAWAYLQPILEENGGWAAFISTTQGRNHFHALYEFARQEMEAGRDWFAQTLTVDDTKAIPLERVESHRRQLVFERGPVEADALIRQEYYCSWDAAVLGSLYGSTLEILESMVPPRITKVPYDPGFPVEVWWDLGIGDDCALWFTQKVGRETRVIDCYSSFGSGVDHYVRVLNGQLAGGEHRRQYTYAQTACVLPHDAGHGQFSQRGGRSLGKVLAQDYGFRNRIVPRTRSLMWSINQVRTFLLTCVFDADKCRSGLEALRMYRKKQHHDGTRTFYSDEPQHDWTSHFADAFRTGVEGQTPAPVTGVVPMAESRRFLRTPERFAEVDENPFSTG